jgi:hypothetical protein
MQRSIGLTRTRLICSVMHICGCSVVYMYVKCMVCMCVDSNLPDLQRQAHIWVFVGVYVCCVHGIYVCGNANLPNSFRHVYVRMFRVCTLFVFVCMQI